MFHVRQVESLGLERGLQLDQRRFFAHLLQRDHIRLGREDTLDNLRLRERFLERPILDRLEDEIFHVVRRHAEGLLRLAKRPRQNDSGGGDETLLQSHDKLLGLDDEKLRRSVGLGAEGARAVVEL